MALETLLDREIMKRVGGKEFGIRPSPKYNRGELVKRAEELYRLETGYGALAKNSGDISASRAIAGIALGYMPGDKAENEQMLKDPYAALDQGAALLKVGKKKMASYVDVYLESVLKALSPDKIIEMSIRALDRDREYAEYRAALESQDAAAIRRIYLETYGKTKDGKVDELFQSYATTATAEQLFTFARIQTDKKRAGFIQKNLTVKTREKSKKGASVDMVAYNPRKAQKYLMGEVKKLKGNPREETLVGMGLMVAQQTAEEAAGRSSGKVIQFPGAEGLKLAA